MQNTKDSIARTLLDDINNRHSNELIENFLSGKMSNSLGDQDVQSEV